MSMAGPVPNQLQALQQQVPQGGQSGQGQQAPTNNLNFRVRDDGTISCNKSMEELSPQEKDTIKQALAQHKESSKPGAFDNGASGVDQAFLGNVTNDLSEADKNKLVETMTGKQGILDKIQNVKEGYDPEILAPGASIKYKYKSIKSEMGLGDKEDKDYLHKYTGFFRSLADLQQQVAKDLGAKRALGTKKSMDELAKSIANGDMDDESFKAAIDSLEHSVKKDYERAGKTLESGIPSSINNESKPLLSPSTTTHHYTPNEIKAEYERRFGK